MLLRDLFMHVKKAHHMALNCNDSVVELKSLSRQAFVLVLYIMLEPLTKEFLCPSNSDDFWCEFRLWSAQHQPCARV
jgi:hypothetical protein